MGDSLANCSACGSRRDTSEPRSLVSVVLLVALALIASGCHGILPIDTTALDTAGMGYESIQQLKSLRITSPEITEIAKARQGGFPDAACVQAIRIFHLGGQVFRAGDAIAGLVQVGMGEDAILELARLNQLGLGVGELQAMRLAGLSDETLLAVARHHSEGKPVLSGASLAGMKNTGLRESTLLELARRGVPDTQADAILSFRRHGANDAAILRRFASS
jgi:hypothetical protein